MTNTETCIFSHPTNHGCSQGFFGGKPSPEDCKNCKSRVPVQVVDGKRVFTTINPDDLLQMNLAARSELAQIADSQFKEEQEAKSRGLGDTIAKATKAVGIKPCGKCKKRQAKLNKMFPYKDGKNSAPSNDTDPPDNS
tara:strand:+ start:6243 stop:6656 length:414 start_codon:yes stop_codon:yes gene_type:complete